MACSLNLHLTRIKLITLFVFFKEIHTQRVRNHFVATLIQSIKTRNQDQLKLVIFELVFKFLCKNTKKKVATYLSPGGPVFS